MIAKAVGRLFFIGDDGMNQAQREHVAKSIRLYTVYVPIGICLYLSYQGRLSWSAVVLSGVAAPVGLWAAFRLFGTRTKK